MKKRILHFSAITALFSVFSMTLNAQEINFGTYADYTVTILPLGGSENLGFGSIFQGEDKSITKYNASTFSIEAVKYLDLFVTIEASPYLYLEDCPVEPEPPYCLIPFTLEAAYANRAEDNVDGATIITVPSNNQVTVLFPVLKRGEGPPGPPPTPIFEGYDPTEYNETAYLYIYGSIQVGIVNVGSYFGNVSITVNYE